MNERLTARNWIDFALRTLAREGSHALKADVLARRLGISRGSFYWHFTDIEAFHACVIEHWKQAATEAIITDIEQYDRLEERLVALLRHAFGTRASVEVRMRTWAESNPTAQRAVGDVDRRRREYIQSLLTQAGIPPTLAATRAQLLYWAYLGAALSRTKMTGERLDQVVAELKQVGLGGLPLTARAAR